MIIFLPMTMMRLLAAAIAIWGTSSGAEIKVSSLHPLLGDMARKIGGEHVEVVDLLKPNGNLHTFEPAAKDIAQAKGSVLVLASGKKLEPYLDSLKDSLKNSTPPCTILELGEKIPDAVVSDSGEEAHAHAHDPNDGD